ncbi:class I SAM-dependent methyltransferase [Flavobacterium capsici]|uniref:Class I SAM-dependent methyltransferase n=1 Tax=Flavobacterium capsici TaxID=3075618 RepID=A0AA96J4W7_9FLAO|nr:MULTISPECIES: class I SAM-dependent methyltransferase [unclassified Flavobacterium]WNM19639.1 class I SAM-dependent methyltransferase [Flavobacterium sp. PMR2A8]WNM21028.1 class I SAM-dependent methyltransferase [Flavobacterium sp. PMTSA4]
MSFHNNIFYKKTKDYSVSQEVFDLHHNPEFDMLLTFPRPSLEDLPRYYESEDYISHTDGKRSLFEKIYQLVKGIALRRKLKLINTICEKGNLLDIGAGTGDFLSVAKNDNWKVKGIEPNQKAKSIAINKGVDFVNDLNELEDNSFDVITMWHVLEHVPNLEEYITELKRLIKPNGSIIIAVPNYKSFDAKYYQEFWAAYDTPRHLWHFSKKSIKLLFAQQDLKLIDVLPMKFDSYYVSLLSEKYKNGKMNFLNAVWIGWKSNQYGKRKKEFSSHIYIIKNS